MPGEVYQEQHFIGVNSTFSIGSDRELDALGFPSEFAVPMGRADAYITARAIPYHGPLEKPSFRFAVVFDIGSTREYILCQHLSDFLKLAQLVTPMLDSARQLAAEESMIYFPFDSMSDEDDGTPES